jgi:hypothetical protein
MSGLSIDERLRRLEDERDILQTLYLYGHSLDDGREDVFMDCWTPDAALLWPDRAPIRGHAALRDAFRAHSHAPLAWHNGEPARPGQGLARMSSALRLRLRAPPFTGTSHAVK